MALPKTPTGLINENTTSLVQGIKTNMPKGPEKKQEEGKMKETASNTERNSSYDHAQQKKPQAKQKSMMIPFKGGDLKNVVEFAKQFQIPEQFSKSYDMASNLLNTAKSGKNILANLSVGGAQNIASALSFASAFQANTKKQNDANEKDPYEEFLKYLYKETTKLEPLDANEKPTPEYKLWKTLYLASLELFVSEEFLDACRAVVALNKFNLLFLQNFDINSLTG